MASDRSATQGWLLPATKLVAPLLCMSIGGVAAADGMNTGYFGNVAIKGYDPVSYFTDGRATKGSPELSQSWLGATWYFSTAKHRDAFANEPIRYAPQYGGFCALGAANEEASANIDPEAWRIVDGKLYLFSGKEGLEEDFDTRAAQVIVKADARWPEIQRKEFEARQNSN
jgi:YHS domain-containing protein